MNKFKYSLLNQIMQDVNEFGSLKKALLAFNTTIKKESLTLEVKENTVDL